MQVALNGRRDSARLAPSTPWVGSLEDGGSDGAAVLARCQALSGAESVYHVGVQFLLTSRVHERSLRRALRQGFPLAADGRRGGTSGKEEWPNGQPNGERGAPVPDRRAERSGTESAARAAR